jgi:hypothetical protein
MAGNPGLVSVLDVITEVLSLLRAYSPGEPIAAADSSSCLFTLSGLIDGWGAERLTVFRGNVATFTTTAGKQTYTVGPAAALAPASPDWLLDPCPPDFNAVTCLPGQPSSIEAELRILTDLQWAEIPLKSLQSNYLGSVWPNFQPAGYYQLSFFPIPSAAVPVTLYTPLPVGKLLALSSTLQMPPGYQEALVYELAIKVSSKFGPRMPEWLPAAWTAAKSRIKEANFQALDVSLDAALTRDGGGFNGGGSIDFYMGK